MKPIDKVKFYPNKIHKELCEKWLSDVYKRSPYSIENQALFCPYYVPFEGELGADWGIIVNPLSLRFGMPTFEHDFCGCVNKHGMGDQLNPNEWIKKPAPQRSKKGVELNRDTDGTDKEPPILNAEEKSK